MRASQPAFERPTRGACPARHDDVEIDISGGRGPGSVGSERAPFQDERGDAGVGEHREEAAPGVEQAPVLGRGVAKDRLEAGGEGVVNAEPAEIGAEEGQQAERRAIRPVHVELRPQRAPRLARVGPGQERGAEQQFLGRLASARVRRARVTGAGRSAVTPTPALHVVGVSRRPAPARAATPHERHGHLFVASVQARERLVHRGESGHAGGSHRSGGDEGAPSHLRRACRDAHVLSG
jgi:hypothetical protein